MLQEVARHRTLMTYQFDPDMLPDTDFRPGHLKYIVPGNEGRWLDPRRTPVRVLQVNRDTGVFTVELLAFEDRGARWEIPLEDVSCCQFAPDGAEAGAADLALYVDVIARLDRPLEIPSDLSRRPATDARVAALREAIGAWLERESAFLQSRARLDVSSGIGHAALGGDIERYLTSVGLWDLEQAFAAQYVRNPHSGELVKGHRMVLAELGLVSFHGKLVRDPAIFDGPWSKSRRADHILHRLAFVRELFARLGETSLLLYRGMSCEGPPKSRRNDSFVSATFNREIAMSHFDGRDPRRTGMLLRQLVPIDRVFMTCLETAAMNERYKEAEAVLLYDERNALF